MNFLCNKLSIRVRSPTVPKLHQSVAGSPILSFVVKLALQVLIQAKATFVYSGQNSYMAWRHILAQGYTNGICSY